MNVPRARCTAGRLGHSIKRPCRRPTGCPCCVGQKLFDCNFLTTVCLDIAANFDVSVEKNGVSAAELTSSTGTKYSWLSDLSLAPRSVLRLSAQITQISNFSQLTGAPEDAANSDAFMYIRILR